MSETDVGMDLHFITDDIEYSVAEFYGRFHAEFPQVVQVSEGFHGDKFEYNLTKGEVLYIAAASKQKRVVAKVNTGLHTRVLSIPFSFSENLCLSKQRLFPGAKEQSLMDIMKYNWLPVKVRYPPSNVIITDCSIVNASNLPEMELVKKFDEIHLLGNYMIKGMLGEDIIRIPLYIPQLRICRVKGMKYLKQDGWNSHCDLLKEDSKQRDYDLHFGNQYVAEYNHNEINSHTKYAFTEPTLYDDLIKIITSWPECNVANFGDSMTKERSCEEDDKQSNEERLQNYDCLLKEGGSFQSAYETLAVNNTEDKPAKSLKCFTCDEIIERLKALGLDKFSEIFSSEKIDGALLELLDESLLIEEIGMTKDEIARLKDISEQGNVDPKPPTVPPKTYLRRQAVKEQVILGSNKEPEIISKPRQPGNELFRSNPGFEMPKQFNNSDQQCVHASPNTYTPLPKHLTG